MVEKTTHNNHSDNYGDSKVSTPGIVAKEDVLNALQRHSSTRGKQDTSGMNSDNVLHLTTQVASAYFQNNRVASTDVAAVISTIHQSLLAIKNETSAQKKSVVTIGDSLTPDYIICLEDGKKLKMLKRHLRTNFNMSPTEYRAKWGLPPDYPMVAPNYASLRSQFAKQSGLGKERGEREKNKS